MIMDMPGTMGGAKIVFTNTNLIGQITVKNTETSVTRLTEPK
jgi:hypothetical protein